MSDIDQTTDIPIDVQPDAPSEVDASEPMLPAGRVLQGMVECNVEQDAYGNILPDTQRRIVIEVFCPATPEDYHRETKPHFDPNDPRNECQEFARVFHENLRPKLDQGVYQALGQTGFPGVVAHMAPSLIQNPDGPEGDLIEGPMVERQPVPLDRISLAPCHSGSPHSIMIIYMWPDLPPVIMPLPETLVGRQVCGQCEGCLRWLEKARTMIGATEASSSSGEGR